MKLHGSHRLTQGRGRCDEACVQACRSDPDEDGVPGQCACKLGLLVQVEIRQRAWCRMHVRIRQQHSILTMPATSGRRKGGFVRGPLTGEFRFELRCAPGEVQRGERKRLPARPAAAGTQVDPTSECVGIELDVHVAECCGRIGKHRPGQDLEYLG